jgi:phosphomannomutase
MPAKFGTSGLRGLVEELTDGTAARYCGAFALRMQQKGALKPGGEVLIGMDLRPSSPLIASQCAAAIAANGLTPVVLGDLPTPALALEAMARGAAAVMVTGSHIPADRNGIKFYRPDGEVDKADEAAVSALADSGAVAASDAKTSAVDAAAATAARRRFLERNASLLPPGALSGMKVGVWQHSAVARDWLGEILEGFGADVVALDRAEGFVPVDTEAVDPGALARLGAWVREHGLAAIVSTDGDSDRPLVIGDDGAQVRGDLLGLLGALHLGAETVVTPVTSNTGIEGAGTFRVLRTRVGSPYVIEAMASGTGGVIGFEANGGLLTGTPFPGHGAVLEPLPTRDCVLPILTALHAARDGGLAAVVSRFALPVAASGRIEEFAQEKSAAVMAHLRSGEAAAAAFVSHIAPLKRIADIDGVQLFLENGEMLHLRPSGNAPEMRCYAEAATAARAAQLVAEGIRRVHEILEQAEAEAR